MKKIISISIVCFFIFMCSYAWPDEKITLSTYYPAPYGEYRTLAVGDTYLAPAAGGTTALVVEGNVGIGMTNPTAPLDVSMVRNAAADLYGIKWQVKDTQSTNAYIIRGIYGSAEGLRGSQYGGYISAIHGQSTNVNYPGMARGLQIKATNYDTTSSSNTYGMYVESWGRPNGGNVYGMYIDTTHMGSSGESYGIYTSTMGGTSATEYAAYFSDGNVYAAGNVGIGTTNLTQSLNVHGTINLERYNITGQGAGGLLFEGTPSPGYRTWAQRPYDQKMIFSSGYPLFSFLDNATLTMDGATGNVGIGTTNPAQALSVGGTSPAISTDTSDGSDNKCLYISGAGNYSADRGAYIQLNGNEYGVSGDDTGDAVIASGSAAGVSGDILLYPQHRIYIVPMEGGAGDYVVEIENAGNLRRRTSSRRYKDDIQDFKDDFYKILKLKPASFIYKSSGKRGVGYIAEDLDEAGLKDMVVYTEDGLPDAIHSDLVGVYAVEIIKDQQIRLNKLDKDITQLNEQIKSLKEEIDTFKK